MSGNTFVYKVKDLQKSAPSCMLPGRSLSIVSLGFFLLQCLITSTAYDDKFVNKLLSNRTVLDNGFSLNGTSLYDLRHNRMKDHSVRCLVNVENWTAWRLKDALPHNHCGYIDEKYTAVDVKPATREVMLGYKQSGTATGTCGTVSWQIEHLDTRLIVMWSVPFNYNIHNSYFAVGMIFNRGRFSSSNYWFKQMYYSEKGPYRRGEGGQTITYENSAVVVVAHMESSTYHPMLNVSVIPQVRYKLAPLVWRRLYNSERARYTGAASPVRTAGTSSPGLWWTRATILATVSIALLTSSFTRFLSRCHFHSGFKILESILDEDVTPRRRFDTRKSRNQGSKRKLSGGLPVDQRVSDSEDETTLSGSNCVIAN